MMYFPFQNSLFEIQNVFLKKGFGAMTLFFKAVSHLHLKLYFDITQVLATPKLSTW